MAAYIIVTQTLARVFRDFQLALGLTIDDVNHTVLSLRENALASWCSTKTQHDGYKCSHRQHGLAIHTPRRACATRIVPPMSSVQRLLHHTYDYLLFTYLLQPVYTKISVTRRTMPCVSRTGSRDEAEKELGYGRGGGQFHGF